MNARLAVRPTLVLVVALAGAGCQQARGQAPDDFQVTWTLIPRSPTVGAAAVSVELRDHRGVPLTGGAVEIEGDMSHPGMAPVFSRAAEVNPGRYQARLDFTMSGDWILLLSARLSDGRLLTRWHDVRNVHQVSPSP